MIATLPVGAQEVPRTGTQEVPRTDIMISGVYPHLTTYGIYSQNGAHDKPGHNECGIGAVVPWAGKLWMVNYAPHMPAGSEHKLFSVDADLSQPITIHQESVGGTPAGRMIHKESNQLLIAHYAIDGNGHVRTISPSDMPIRVTAIARHLTDPANLVYYIDMEGSIWEANVHTLDVRRLFEKPVPGWHGKGGYTSQGRLVVSNNGEHAAGSYDALLVGGPARNEEERGVLAEWDGREWRIIERRQYTEVTGPPGILGGSDGVAPIWAMGWDRRSLRLKLLEEGRWHTYLLPKAAYCNDARHGWYTEWPRIREITAGRWMMDMHGMFFNFPVTFSSRNSAGITPIGSHLRYVPDFCAWNNRLVLATDETSIQGNRLAGQPQSNLWFGQYEDLYQWGPANGYGGPWLEDAVTAGTPSDPFLVAGFDRRVLHLAVGQLTPELSDALRASDQQRITSMPRRLADLPRVTIRRGDWHQPAPGFSFEIDQPAKVYLAVDRRGSPQLPASWRLTDLSLSWGRQFQDDVYVRDFPPGKVPIPGNSTEHTSGSYGMPHAAFVAPRSSVAPTILADDGVTVTLPNTARSAAAAAPASVQFTLEVDRGGTGEWSPLDIVEVPDAGSVIYYPPADLDAVWLRLTASHDCIATAFLHQTTDALVDGSLPSNRQMFQGLADVNDQGAFGGLVFAAQRNRNLRVISGDDRYFEFTKIGFEFQPDVPDAELKQRLQVEPEFSVDEASVIIRHQGRNLRLPKGDAAFDRPFATGWPRAVREVESERQLANIHGTFYEIPLVTNGAPPAWNLMRPVASHSKQITDYCSWNGLLVLAGVKADAVPDGRVFTAADHDIGLWFGGVDDLWKLGKPVGRGGPWKTTAVQANVPSDPYLMTGYDRKRVALSHESKTSVTFTLQVDINGNGLWVDYGSYDVTPGATFEHEFPAAFSACWIRVVADRDTTATAWLEYGK